MNTQNERFMLDVPFPEKDRAKELGARWDPDFKRWFVPAGRDLVPFAKWFPKENGREGRRDGAGSAA